MYNPMNDRGETDLKPPLVIIAGPTACGKTDTAVLLAQRIGGEIISADSMQVYRHMDIGTAKPTVAERGGIPHHLLDVCMPDTLFSVAQFKDMAKTAIDGILDRGHVPILAGGTGFYINAILYNTQFSEEENDGTLRRELAALGETHGQDYLHKRLADIDPASALAIHPNNVKRVIRAIEYFHLTGEPISAHNAREKEKEPYYNAPFFVLYRERESLYRHIEQRVDAMMQAGLLAEVKALYDQGYAETLPAMQGLGYKELFPVVAGKMAVEEGVRILKQNTRHFAKRQLTWFRSIKNCFWINVDELDEKCIIVDSIIMRLVETGVIKV